MCSIFNLILSQETSEELGSALNQTGKDTFQFLVDGDPKLISGQTITAILKHPDDWQTVLGIRIHENGEIFAPDIGLGVWLLILTTFFAGIWYMELQHSHPEALAPTLAGHAFIATFVVHNAIVARRIR